MDLMDNRPTPKNKKIILSICIIFLIALGLFVCYYKGYSFTDIKYLLTKKASVNSKVVLHNSFDVNLKPIFLTYEDLVLEVNTQGIKAYNLNNKLEWQINQKLASPIVKVEGKYIVLADEGGKNLYLFVKNKMQWSKATSGNIVDIKIAKNGYVLVITEINDQREVLVYSPAGNLILNKSYALEEFIVNADISENKKAVILSAYTAKDKVESKIDYYELKNAVDVNNKPIWGIVKENMLAIDISIFNNGNIVVAGDTGVFALDNSGSLKWTKDFNNLKVYKANISSRSYIVLETNGTSKANFIENRVREIEVINQDGKIEGDQIKVQTIQNIDAFGGFFLVNDSSKIYSISKGKLILSCPLEKDIKYIKGFTTKSQILTVGKDFWDIVEIN